MAEIRALLRGCSDARSAWRTLTEKGILPASFQDDLRRRFVHEPSPSNRHAEPIRDPIFAEYAAQPQTVEQCALFAADSEAILVAEAAAFLLAERLIPWGAPPVDRVLWWFIPASYYGYASQDTRPGVHYAMLSACNALAEACSQADSLFGHSELWSQRWAAQASAGSGIPRQYDPRPGLLGRRFRELPNPFEALAALEATGYAALEYVGATGRARGVMPLVAPLG